MIVYLFGMQTWAYKTPNDLLIFPTQRMELLDSQINIKKLVKVAELYFLLLR